LGLLSVSSLQAPAIPLDNFFGGVARHSFECRVNKNERIIAAAIVRYRDAIARVHYRFFENINFHLAFTRQLKTYLLLSR
jgi:hypothetical protein